MAAGGRSPGSAPAGGPACPSPSRRLSTALGTKSERSQRAAACLPPPRLLSVGGREGPGQRINGDYELVEGWQPNGRPCWLRRGLQGTGPNGPSEEGDDRPLYLFFGDMGYWSIASSVHAAGVHVLARSGPDFSTPSPDLSPQAWTVFAFGKARQDRSVVCFRHDTTQQPPEAIHVLGCKGDHVQLNGNYFHVPGVAIGSRPVFVKEDVGFRGRRVDPVERKLFHFSQRSGRWLISSASFGPDSDSAIAASDSTSSAWRGATVLARSPLAWTSTSPVHLPREAWSVLKDLPPKLLHGSHRPRRVTLVLDHDDALSNDEEEEQAASTFIPCLGLHVQLGVGSALRSAAARSRSVSSSGSVGSDASETPRALEEHLVRHEDAVLLFCIHLPSPLGMTDSFGLNGDYAMSVQIHGDRPVFIKVPLRPPAEGAFRTSAEDRELCLFFDDYVGRWQVAPSLCSKDILLRGPPGCIENLPAPTDSSSVVPWQVRVPDLDVSLNAAFPRRRRSFAASEATPAFQDSALEVRARTEDRKPPRTVAFVVEGLPGIDGATSSSSQALVGHPLEGDFRLLRQRYGRRPVYRRAGLQAASSGPGLPAQPPLFMFFEPRSGYWIVSTISPLATNHAQASSRPDVPGRFGQVLARSGPSWSPLFAEETQNWDVADSQEPGNHHRHGLVRAAPASRLLSESLLLTPWLRLRALGGGEAPPSFLCVGGCGSRLQSLNGTYELLPETMWGSRPAWRRLPSKPDFAGEVPDFPRFVFFWPETGHWIIGSDLHCAHTGLARNGPSRWAAQSPDHCPGRWAALSGLTFEEDPRIFCRWQKSVSPRRSRGLRPLVLGLATTERAAQTVLQYQHPNVNRQTP
ncbi:unnamed protein product [Polarella glacialis]|uniref:Uncharacterized protein n=1 Tax=Polarella glacialis TaxID=89957 RepID=A0A813HJI1_POLGL|nr:unnamed protein product [Polarella glacialis]